MMRSLLKIGIITSALLLASISLFGQKHGDIKNTMEPFYSRYCKSSFSHHQLTVETTLAEALYVHLRETLSSLNSEKSALTLQHEINSIGGVHFTYEQTYLSLPVFMSQVKVNLNNSAKIYSIFDNSYNTSSWNSAYIQAQANGLAAADLVSAYKSKHDLKEAIIDVRIVVAAIDLKSPAVLKELTIRVPATSENYVVLVDKELNELYRQDLNSYSGGTIATAFVFKPDPVTTANVAYLAPFVDSADIDIPALNAERVQVNIDVTLNGGVYELESDYIVIQDFSQPSITPPTSNSGVFNFTRGQDGFEDVNAYYHLQQYNNFIRGIGHDYIADFLIRVDAHALQSGPNGSDQSVFTPNGGSPQLLFGEGGVDDAEDADVIVHEYGHALSDRASPGSNSGQQRKALDEGIGDYIAASYSKSISSARWFDVFTWDGHNEYWGGRTAQTTLTYPNDVGSGFNIHNVGQIWSTTLMEVYDALGREISDKLALEALYSFAVNMDFCNATDAYLQADDLLYQGAHRSVLEPIFASHINCNVGISNVDETGNLPNIQVINTQGLLSNNEPIIISSNKPLKSAAVFNLTGQLLHYVVLDNELQFEYDLSFLNQNGIYVLQVTDISGDNFTTKLAK